MDRTDPPATECVCFLVFRELLKVSVFERLLLTCTLCELFCNPVRES